MTKGDVSQADAGAAETANYDMGQPRGNRRTQAAELFWSDGSATHPTGPGTTERYWHEVHWTPFRTLRPLANRLGHPGGLVRSREPGDEEQKVAIDLP